MTTKSNPPTVTSTPPALLAGRQVRELVVPVTDDGHIDRVVPLMASLAQRWAVPIRLVHVTPSISSIDPGLDEAKEVLRSWYPEATIGATHLSGDDPAAAIADTAGAGSLVVMSTDDINRWQWRESVAEEVVERLGAPVILVGPNVTKAALRQRGIAGEVVVGIDGSAVSEQGVAPAVALAESIDQPIRLVDVKGRDTTDDPHPLTGRYLDRLADDHRDRVDASWEVLYADDPVAGLEALADRRNASFLVVTTAGKRGLSRKTMASISSGLAESAARPVLVVSADWWGGRS